MIQVCKEFFPVDPNITLCFCPRSVILIRKVNKFQSINQSISGWPIFAVILVFVYLSHNLKKLRTITFLTDDVAMDTGDVIDSDDADWYREEVGKEPDPGKGPFIWAR